MSIRSKSIMVALALLLPMTAALAQQAASTAVPAQVAAAVKNTDYGTVRIKTFPVAVECWTFRKYTFLETLDKVKALGLKYIEPFPGQAIGGEFGKTGFDQNLTKDQMAALRKKISEAGLKLIGFGVVDTGRTEADMRKVFDFASEMGIPTIVCEPQDGDLAVLDRLVKEYDIRIAIHNHPSPSKYWSPVIAYDHIKDLDPRIGVCADTGHWMRGGFHPTECLRLLEGRIIDCHLKDRSDFGQGKTAYDVAWGSGKAGMKDILAELTLQDYAGCLTMEYENEKEVMTPEPAIKKSVEFVADAAYYKGYDQLLKRYGWNYEKHGWNHYGPGYFELDARTGILKSQGGMGLLWYSVKQYKDFILEVDFKCSKTETNSGVFIRVPGVPTSDDYIYHSFEIQIDDQETGIHKTAAIYDVEAPKLDASRATGEWNHMKITCKGRLIQVELNGKLVIDWQAVPGGKVKDFALQGYIGLQNHDSTSPVYFRNIYIKEL